MWGLAILIAAVALALFIGWLHSSQRARRREEIASVPLTDSERATLVRHVACFARLPEEVLSGLVPRMRVFLDEISFEACGGVTEVTEDMRLVVAAQACLLLVNSGYEDFGRLRSVLMYPGAYRARDHDGSEDVRLGESWDRGSVVLGWEDVLGGAANDEDGHNLVLHEFAHQLDQAEVSADGVPKLKRAADYQAWAEAFGEAYDRHCEDVEAGRRTGLDPYGATNPAEFFAVATETFFEKPRRLQREYPDVYREMEVFYGLDPAKW